MALFKGRKNLLTRKKPWKKAQSEKREADRLLKDAELELASVEAEKKQAQDKLYGGKVTNSKELSQLEKDLQQLDRRREKLDEQVLRGMDKIEKVNKEFSTKEQACNEVRTRCEADQSAHETRKEQLAKRLAELQTKRDTFTQSIDETLLERYANLKARKGGLAIVKVQKNTCGGCFMQVPESSMQKVKVLELEYCSSCGRILYLDKEMGN